MIRVFKKFVCRLFKEQQRKVKSLFIIAVMLISFVVFYNIQASKAFSQLKYIGNNKMDSRIVHLDLKGAPPKPSYFKKLFPILKNLGATGLLIEYEDMFPYYGNVVGNISAMNSYTIEDIKAMNEFAYSLGLEVIPLVQTFGHLEFVLKLKEFQEFREVPNYPQAICPSHPYIIKIIKTMLKQVLHLHPKSKTIHIGAGKVYFLGMCDRCRTTMVKFGWSKEKLFLNYVEEVASWLKKNYMGIGVVMWDDQLREMDSKLLNSSSLSSLVVPAVLQHSSTFHSLPPATWKMYSETFQTIWIASAYKGTTGSNQYHTNILYHLQNHQAWLATVDRYKGDFNFAGIMMTGSQRYNHFSILCELLPVAIPSLGLCLQILMNSCESFTTQQMIVGKKLQCQQPIPVTTSSIKSCNCLYPGGQIFDLITKFQQLEQQYSTILENSVFRGWMNDYNVKYTFSSPSQLENALKPHNLIRTKINKLEKDLENEMKMIYDDYTINEFWDSYIIPFKEEVFHLFENKEKLLSRKSWPRKPLDL